MRLFGGSSPPRWVSAKEEVPRDTPHRGEFSLISPWVMGDRLSKKPKTRFSRRRKSNLGAFQLPPTIPLGACPKKPGPNKGISPKLGVTRVPSGPNIMGPKMPAKRLQKGNVPPWKKAPEGHKIFTTTLF